MPERNWLMRVGVATSVLALALLVGSVSSLVSHAAWQPRLPLGLDLYMPVPEDNPLTRDKVELGRQLVSDPILSRDKRLACAGCHEPERAFTDERTVSRGVFGRQGTRHVPTLINRGYGRAFFWDGRISSLEEQVLQPIQDPTEMDMTLKDVVERLRRDRKYSELFQAVFGRIPTHVDLANALASYVRTILSGDAPIDRYLNGEREALSQQERQGLGIFNGKGNCWVCHFGPTFTDERFHNTGVAWQDGALLDMDATWSPAKRTIAAPSRCRRCARWPGRRPTCTTGASRRSRTSLTSTTAGGNANPYQDAELRRLNLTTTEKQALISFLHALSGRVQDGIPTR